MNRSPEHFFQELADEQRLASARSAPAEAELAADWKLRQELRQLTPPELPAGLRNTILSQTARPARPVRWLALAAAITLAIGLGLSHWQQDTPAPTVAVSEQDLKDLELALATLGESGRLAGRELAAHLSWPELGPLPYTQQIQTWIQPPKPTQEKESPR